MINTDVLRALIMVDPEGVMVPFSNSQRLPIHYAARHSKSGEAIQVWIDAYPKGITHKDEDGFLPLHHAAHSTNVNVVQVLIDSYPRAVAAVDKYGRLPLHLAVLHSGLDIVQTLIAVYPEGAGYKDRNGRHPLDLAIINSSSAGVIRVLITAFPEVVKKRDESDRLPLHLAARYSKCADVVRVLCTAFPEGIKCMDELGRLPLHHAAAHSRVEVVLALIAADAESVMCKDVGGRLPLHLAAMNSKSVDVIQAVITAFPDGVINVDNDGHLPLHIAAEHSSSLNVIRALIATYPKGMNVADSSGRYPVQLTATRECKAELTALVFLHEYPQFIDKRNYLQNDHLKDLWGAYYRAFTPTMSDLSNFCVHICGEPYAGKSVLFHWISNILKQNRSLISRVGDLVGINATSHDITPNDRRATRGMVSETVNYTTHTGRSLHCILHDYGAQAQFKLTHPQHLSCPASIYVIVLPLFSKEIGVWNTINDLYAQLLDWLRMIYSVKHVFMHEHDGGNTSQVPVLVVINTFSTIVTPNGAPIVLAQIRKLIADVKLYFTDMNSVVQELFHFMEPVLIDARAKGEAYRLETPIIEASEMVCGTKIYSRYDCVEFVLSHLPVWPNLLMTKEEVLSKLTAVFQKHNYQRFYTMRSLVADVSLYLETQQPIGMLAEFCFKVMVEMKCILVLDTNTGQEDMNKLVVTNPNMLTNRVLGEVLYTASKNSIEGIHRIAPLVYSSEELDNMVPDLPTGITVSMVLETLGLAMPVTVSRTNEILPAITAGSNVMYLLGLIDEAMPVEVKLACQSALNSNTRAAFDVLEGNSQGSTILRSVSRLFTLQNKRCSFIPGFFMKLFIFIHKHVFCPLRCWYW